MSVHVRQFSSTVSRGRHWYPGQRVNTDSICARENHPFYVSLNSYVRKNIISTSDYSCVGTGV